MKCTCVCCGSGAGRMPRYCEAARVLGHEPAAWAWDRGPDET